MSLLEEHPEIAIATLIHLNWHGRGADIVVTPSDQDRFVIKVGRAIEILRQHQRQKDFEKQFDLLLKQLAAWLDENTGRWERAFLTAGESILRFIVVRKQARAEPDVTDSLSDLGVKIANDPDLDLIKLSARALPCVSDDALQSFLDPAFSIEYDGNGAGTHCASESQS